MQSYNKRIDLCPNPTAKKLLAIMQDKQSNLALSADVTTSFELLALADQLGPYICVLKTHIDIINDFSRDLTTKLTDLAHKHNFIIFEDRKFADIGHTAALQYSQGIYQIANWSQLTNAHPIPGPGIIDGLQQAGLPRGNGLLLLAQMSSKGALTDEQYCQQTLDLACQYPEFVVGFIARQRLTDNQSFIYLTPGVKLEAGTDSLGQQYLTPETAIIDNRTDVIIVGRGIYQHADPKTQAKQYQKRGWQAYLRSLSTQGHP